MVVEEFAYEAQIKRLYAVLHSLGYEPKEWKKEHNIGSYAKLTREECSKYIDELEAIEAERKAKLHQDIISGLQKQILLERGVDVKAEQAVEAEAEAEAEAEERDAEAQSDEVHAQAEVSKMAVTMRFCTLEAKKIADELCKHGGITEGTKAGMIQKLATTMFIEAMRRGL